MEVVRSRIKVTQEKNVLERISATNLLLHHAEARGCPYPQGKVQSSVAFARLTLEHDELKPATGLPGATAADRWRTV